MKTAPHHNRPFVVIALSGLLAALPAWAVVNVTDYSWLQLAAGDVTAQIGSSTGIGGSGHGSPADFRWGNFVWTPSDDLTNTGGAAYWGVITLDKARNVQTVAVEAWCTVNQTLKSFHIDGYQAGPGWVNDIGAYDYGVFKTSNPGYTAVPVTAGSYSAIRVRFEPGEYQDNGASYGGPGLYTIEPRGDASLDLGDTVNWADKDNFGTTVVNNLAVGAHGDVRGNTNWNSGLLGDSLNGNGTGQYNPGMVAGEYLEVDLKAVRTIDAVTLVGMHTYVPTAFSVEWSLDDITYTPLAPLSSTMLPATGYQGANVQTFSPFDARYVHVTYANRPNDYWLISQVLVSRTLPVPEPGTVILLALGALLAGRRRQ